MKLIRKQNKTQKINKKYLKLIDFVNLKKDKNQFIKKTSHIVACKYVIPLDLTKSSNLESNFLITNNGDLIISKANLASSVVYPPPIKYLIKLLKDPSD
jgi:hypothetical protein